MNMYPSRGNHLHGFEIKVSRPDWLKERKDASKAEAVARYCSYWHLVTIDVDIVKPGELPEPWGHIALKDGKLVEVVKPKLLAYEEPTRGFIAACLASADRCEQQRSGIEEVRTAAFDHGYAAGKKSADGEGGNWQVKYDRLQSTVRTFEEVSGIAVDHEAWRIGKVAEAVRVLISATEPEHVQRIRSFKSWCQGIVTDIERAERILDRSQP